MYGLGVAKGLAQTIKHLFRPPVTVQFPEEKRNVPPRARTNLLWFDERCTGCSTCAQACPYEAIQPGGTYEDAVYVFDDMYKDKHALTTLARQYLASHSWTYPNGAKAPFGNDRAEAVSKTE